MVRYDHFGGDLTASSKAVPTLWAGIIWGLFTAVAPVPRRVRTKKKKKKNLLLWS